MSTILLSPLICGIFRFLFVFSFFLIAHTAHLNIKQYFLFSFWPSLLADTIPLLESKQPQFSAKETNVILHHLENQFIPFIEKRKNLVKSGKVSSLNLLNDCRIENIDDMIMLLRLACARNLARAFIIENTVLP